MDSHEDVLEALDQTVVDFDPKAYSIVDPEVRAYVYSLCSAVSARYPPNQHNLTMKSSEARQPTTTDATFWETMHWPY